MYGRSFVFSSVCVCVDLREKVRSCFIIDDGGDGQSKGEQTEMLMVPLTA